MEELGAAIKNMGSGWRRAEHRFQLPTRSTFLAHERVAETVFVRLNVVKELEGRSSQQLKGRSSQQA
ncbi:MAG: hypothetical protein ABSE53_12265 [Terracidiphilus sp.]|jgi:hypothetical protein